MKKIQFLIVGVVSMLLANALFAQIIVDDDFESYANDAAFQAAWVPMDGQGRTTVGGPVGILLPRPVNDPIQPPAPYDGSGDATVFPAVDPLVGQAVAFADGGSINEWDNDGNPSTDPFQLQPDANSNIRYEADLFDFVDGNRRFSAGLRHDDDTDAGLFGIQQTNLVELGFWNANAVDPTDGATPIPDPAVHGVNLPGYAYRVILFSNPGDPLIQNPNWQFFELPAEFDDATVDHNNDGRLGNGDGLVTAADVGPGWHRFSAEISESSVTVELDLFRDGSVDASQTWDIEMSTSSILNDVAYFNSLRLGGPSGISANEFTMVDNVKLEVVSASQSLACDFDGDGDCDHADLDELYLTSPAGADIDAWLTAASDPANATLPAGATLVIGDIDLDGNVNSVDLGLLLNNFNSTSGLGWIGGNLNADANVDSTDLGLLLNNFNFTSPLASAVPEPSSLALLGMALLGLGGLRRRQMVKN